MIFRALFFLLILVNLIFYTWTQRLWGSYDGGHEPQRLGQQMNADRLRVLPNAPIDGTPVDLVALSAPQATTASPASADATPAKAGDTVATNSDRICRLIAGLQDVSVLALKQSVDALGWQSRLLQKVDPFVHVVLIPELANEEAAETKVGELARRDVKQFKVIALRNQIHEIHFGSFADEPAAQALWAELKQKGVKSARLVQRKDASRLQLEVTGPREQLDARLPPLLAAYEGVSSASCTAQLR